MKERPPCEACGDKRKWTQNELYNRWHVCSRECFHDHLLSLMVVALQTIAKGTR